MKTKKCCICGATIYNWGNNPWGALDKNGNVIKWRDDDVCCDECNSKYVIAGRLFIHAQASKEKKK